MGRIEIENLIPEEGRTENFWRILKLMKLEIELTVRLCSFEAVVISLIFDAFKGSVAEIEEAYVRHV